MNDDQDLKTKTDTLADETTTLVDETTPSSDPLADQATPSTEPATDDVIPNAVEIQNEDTEGQEDKDDSEDVEGKDGQKGLEDEEDLKDEKQVPSEPSEPSESSEPSNKADESEESDKADSEPSQPSESSQPSNPSDEPSKPSKPDPKGAHWYVVHTYSGHEAKVATTLKQRIDSQKIQDKILDILVPTQEKIEIKEGKKNTIKEKIFPGYILIRMVLDDISWLAVRTTPGVTSFVGNANKPTPLSEAEVETIKRFMSMEAPKFKTAFAIGEAVKIIEGPFAEFLGSIAEIDEEKGKLKVMVSIFGRETPVELDFLQVNKL